MCERVLNRDSACKSGSASAQRKSKTSISNRLSAGNSKCCMTATVYAAVLVQKYSLVRLRKSAKLRLCRPNEQRSSQISRVRRVGRLERCSHVVQLNGGQARFTRPLHKRIVSFSTCPSAAMFAKEDLMDKSSKATQQAGTDFKFG